MLWVLRAQGLPAQALFNVYRGVVIAELLDAVYDNIDVKRLLRFLFLIKTRFNVFLNLFLQRFCE